MEAPCLWRTWCVRAGIIKTPREQGHAPRIALAACQRLLWLGLVHWFHGNVALMRASERYFFERQALDSAAPELITSTPRMVGKPALACLAVVYIATLDEVAKLTRRLSHARGMAIRC